jgi:3-methyl-2-oxobutanoate hydroxymethyltransferase
MSSSTPSTARVTAGALAQMKASGIPVVMLTAYDYATARLVDSAGVDVVLVGDSLGMTVLGYDSTLPVTVDDMVRATAAVSRACAHALVVADMPFMSYQASIEDGMRNAGRMLAEGGAQAVKLEGATEHALELTYRLVESGIPVMGHVGLTPQSVNTLGGYKVQAREAEAAAQLLADVVDLWDAGAFAVVLECIPVELAQRASAMVPVPTIGIGAGVGCDGQVQVIHDLLGMGTFTPKHARRYAEIGDQITAAVSRYADDVRSKEFPAEPQSTHADPELIVRAEAIFAAAEEV